MLFNSIDHENSGKKLTFAELIEQLNFLADEGIWIESATKITQVYFVLALI